MGAICGAEWVKMISDWNWIKKSLKKGKVMATGRVFSKIFTACIRNKEHWEVKQGSFIVT